VTTGAGRNLQQISAMAQQIVTKFGISELGLSSLESQQVEVILGRDWMTRSEYLEAIASPINTQIREIIEKCYKNTKKIMRDKWRQLCDTNIFYI